MQLGFLFAIVGTLLFSLKSILIKLLYAEGLDYHSVLVLRMLIATPFYLIILIIYIKKSAISLKIITQIIILGFFGYYLASLLDLMSLKFISAQLERLTLFTYPLLTAVLALWWFKQAISREIIISLALTYLGLSIVVLQKFTTLGGEVWLGTSLALGAALSFALYVLFSKPIIMQIGSVLFVSIAMFSSGLFVFIHGSAVLDFNALVISYKAWQVLFLLAVFSTIIPSFLLAEAIKRIGAVKTGITGTLGPVFTIGLAFYLLGETMSTIALIGMLLVLGGVSNLVIKPNR